MDKMDKLYWAVTLWGTFIAGRLVAQDGHQGTAVLLWGVALLASLILGINSAVTLYQARGRGFWARVRDM
jgi:hypothetical protein